MLKSIPRFKRLDRAIKLEHHIGIASSRKRSSGSPANFGLSPAKLTGHRSPVSRIRPEFVIDSRFTSNFTEESAATDTYADIDPFEKAVNDCNDLASLLRLIESGVTVLGGNQLSIVYQKINQLFLYSILNSSGLLLELRSQAQASPVFQSLLSHTDSLVEGLSTSCLIKVFETFDWIDLDSQNQSFKCALNQLNSRLNGFDLEEIVNCLNLVIYHMERPNATNELFQFGDQLTQAAKSRIRSDGLAVQAIDTTVKCFFSFLNSRYDAQNVIIDKIVDRLRSSDVQLNYKQSVRLLKEIQKNYILTKEKRERLRYPLQLGSLIEKCNDTIYQTFASGSTDQELYFYLINLHRHTMISEFAKLVPNFFDERQNRLLIYLSQYVLDQFNFNDRIPFYICNLAQNYANFNIYDHRLLKLIYTLISSKPDFRAQMNVSHIYNLLTRFKLPFVEHQHLSDHFLAELTDQSRRSFSSTKKDKLFLLINLALNNVANEDLYDYLVEQLDQLDAKFYKQLDFRDLIRMTLGRACLQFSRLNEEHENKVKAKFDELIDTCLNYISIGLTDRFIRVDHRLQRDGFLSNGVHLGPFGIYDHSTGKLVPLTNYLNCFFKVDRISERLLDNQTM